MSDTSMTTKEKVNDQAEKMAVASGTVAAVFEAYADTFTDSEPETAAQLKKVASDVGKFALAADLATVATSEKPAKDGATLALEFALAALVEAASNGKIKAGTAGVAVHLGGMALGGIYNATQQTADVLAETAEIERLKGMLESDLSSYDKFLLRQQAEKEAARQKAMGMINNDWGEADSPCFAKGTMITTPFGEVPIEELRVGDKVMAFDSMCENGRGRLVAKEVSQLFLNRTSEFLKLTWEEGNNTKEITTTPGHHFLREDGYFGCVTSAPTGII